MNDTEAALAALATVGEALMAAAAHQCNIIRANDGWPARSGDSGPRLGDGDHVQREPCVPVDTVERSGTVVQRFWRWKDRPRAGGGIEYNARVTLWKVVR